MRVGIATVWTPPVRGGAEFLADGLAEAFARAGHRVYRITSRFEWGSADARASAALWRGLDLDAFGGGGIDRLVCLKWPSWYVRHPNAVGWLLHQHRPAYDLFGTASGFADDAEGRALASATASEDGVTLRRLRGIHTISARVSERLRASLGIASTPLYHPPAHAERFSPGDYLPYVLVPSRLEALKRQDLLLRALALTPSPIVAVIVGEGGAYDALVRLAQMLGLDERVRFLGAVPRSDLIALYEQAACVFFGPYDEDYGYVTLEAMLAARPVVTCTDSGGPLEFVVDGETGFVVEPDPEAIARVLDRLVGNETLAARLGRAGRARYDTLDIGWQPVVETLLACSPMAVDIGAEVAP